MAGYGNRPSRGAGGAVSSGPPAPSRKEAFYDIARKSARPDLYNAKASDVPTIQRAIVRTMREINGVQVALDKPKFERKRSLTRQLDRHGNVSFKEERLQRLRVLEGMALRASGLEGAGIAAARVRAPQRSSGRGAARAAARDRGYYVR